MFFMVVTSDVSKLSGWLNADAPCRESNGGHTMWAEVQTEAAGDGPRRTQRAGEGATADREQGTGGSAPTT